MTEDERASLERGFEIGMCLYGRWAGFAWGAAVGLSWHEFPFAAGLSMGFAIVATWAAIVRYDYWREMKAKKKGA